MANPKLLITGGCGFIFSNFIRQCIYTKQPYTLSSLDRVRDNHLYNVYINDNHSFHIADIRDPHILKVIFHKEKPDIVIHAAALSFVDDSIKDASSFITTNVLGTQNVIDACLNFHVKKLVYISSDEIFGHLLNENDKPWTEESPANPRNPYSASKYCGELLVKAAHETHGLTYQITRSCNNYGPWQDPEKLIPKIIKNVLDNKPVPIYDKGMQIRDWIHVFDKCSALFRIINEGKDNEIYNISAGQEFTNIEVFQIICNAIGKGHDLLTFVPDRPGHDFRYSIDSSKLKNLGWKPEVKFREGVEQTVNWYLNNRYVLGL